MHSPNFNMGSNGGYPYNFRPLKNIFVYHVLIYKLFARDKFLKNENSSEKELKTVQLFRRKYGKKIVKKYRKDAPSKYEYQQKDVPTFREFVEYVINQDLKGLDQHWVPIYNLCMPCHINYTIIGRYFLEFI